MALDWTDKVNGVDENDAADVNALAAAIIQNEKDISGKYEKPINGIPKTDLSSDVQASLDKADTAVQDISGKVDKEPGKGLSANDYTNTDKSKLDGIETGAEVNAVDDVEQNGESVVDENKVARIDAYKKEDALLLMCPQTETTDTVIVDAIAHNVIDYTIYGAAGGVGDEVIGSNKYVIPIKIGGNNLFNPYELYPNESYTNNGITLTHSGQGFVLNGERTDKTKVYSVYSEEMELSAGSYTFTIRNTYNIRYIAMYVYSRVNGHDANLLATSVIGNISGNWYRIYTQRFTLEETTKIRFMSFMNYNTNFVYNNDYFVAQLVKGTYSNGTMIPYEPYFNYTANIYLDSPLMEGDNIKFAETNIPLLLSQNTNIIEFGTNVQPSSVRFKYYQDINKVIANLQALILNQ